MSGTFLKRVNREIRLKQKLRQDIRGIAFQKVEKAYYTGAGAGKNYFGRVNTAFCWNRLDSILLDDIRRKTLKATNFTDELCEIAWKLL